MRFSEDLRIHVFRTSQDEVFFRVQFSGIPEVTEDEEDVPLPTAAY